MRNVAEEHKNRETLDSGLGLDPIAKQVLIPSATLCLVPYLPFMRATWQIGSELPATLLTVFRSITVL